MKNKTRFTLLTGVLFAGMIAGITTTGFGQVIVTEPVDVAVSGDVTTDVDVITPSQKPVGVIVAQGKVMNVEPVTTVVSAPSGVRDDKQKAIKIFCKILDHELSDKLGDGYNSKSFFSEGCRGFWIPETGVVINLNVNFPVHQEKVDVKVEEKKVDKDDLWDQFDAELSGKADPNTNQAKMFYKQVYVSSGDVDWSSDEHTKKLKDIILNVLAEYGYRCKEQLNIDNGKMIVIISGQGGPFNYSFSQGFTWKSGDNEPLTLYMKSKDEFGRQEEAIKKMDQELSKQQDHLKEILSLQERQLDIAKRSLDRALQQHKAGVVSQDEVDNAEKEMTAQQIELEKARANLELAQKGLKDKALLDEKTELKRLQSIMPDVPKPAPQPNIQMKIPNVPKDVFVPFNYQSNGMTTMVIQIPFDQLSESRKSKESLESLANIVSY